MSTLDYLYDALTKKVQIANKDITREIVEDWIGNAGYEAQQIAFMSVTLSELASGQYTPEKMAEDILQLACLDH